MTANLKSLLVIGALVIPMAAFALMRNLISTKLSDAIITAKVKAEFAKDERRKRNRH